MIAKIHLESFRNFRSKSLDFSNKITTIVGPNASGKTNILESLFLLSTGKSFKARLEEEMVNYDKDIARVRGSVVSSGTSSEGEDQTMHKSELTLEAVVTRGLIDIGADRPEKVARKRLSVNGVAKRMVDFAGNFKTTLFGPWDMELVTESPSIRRKFLDTVLSQVDREYRRSVLSYDKGLRQRNRLLFRIREEGVPRGQLIFWNQLLIKNGDYISQKREEFIDYVNKSNNSSNSANPISKAEPNQNLVKYRLEYDRSVISEGRLEQYKDEEVAAATTLVGPHRDDMQFQISNLKFKIERELAAYGSRGEQRMGVLWLKMAELNFVEEKTSERPTLLLDDIFSELDHEHRDVVMGLAKKQQTVITTADKHFLKGLKSGVIINL